MNMMTDGATARTTGSTLTIDGTLDSMSLQHVPLNALKSKVFGLIAILKNGV